LSWSALEAEDETNRRDTTPEFPEEGLVGSLIGGKAGTRGEDLACEAGQNFNNEPGAKT
jgi:hypothetical protein